MPLKRLVFALASIVVAIVAASCQEPTRVVVEARTNVAHKPGYVTSFTVGPHASLEGTPPTTESREPWGEEGFIGSLVVVPGESNPEALSVKLVLGVRRDARECEPPTYAGCIVARRKLRFVTHERLRLPITLYAQCENVPCDAESTCNFLGQCVSASVDQGSCETDDGCTVTGDRPTTIPKPGDDASVSVSPDGSKDAPSDASDAADAVADSNGDATNGSDGSFSEPPGYIKCPPATCTPTYKCCAYSGNNTCILQGSTCPAPSVEVYCDGREDCPLGQTCCVESDSIAKCRTTLCVGVSTFELCHTSNDCSGGRACSSDSKWAAAFPTCQ